jgi:hypothetical protein
MTVTHPAYQTGMHGEQNTKFGHSIVSKVKVKESRNRSGVAQRVPGAFGSQIFMTFGT